MALRPDQLGVAHRDSLFDRLSPGEQFTFEQEERDIDDGLAKAPPRAYDMSFRVSELVNDAVMKALVELYRGAGWIAEDEFKRGADGKFRCLRLRKRNP
jgi:hypothetical protein